MRCHIARRLLLSQSTLGKVGMEVSAGLETAVSGIFRAASLPFEKASSDRHDQSSMCHISLADGCCFGVNKFTRILAIPHFVFSVGPGQSTKS